MKREKNKENQKMSKRKRRITKKIIEKEKESKIVKGMERARARDNFRWRKHGRCNEFFLREKREVRREVADGWVIG